MLAQRHFVATFPLLIVALAGKHAAYAGIAPPAEDIFLSAIDGRLTTGGFSDETERVVSPVQRVFAATLGEDDAFPLSTDEPGIRSDLPSVWASWNLLPGMQAWTGTGLIASSTILSIEYGAEAADSSSGGRLSFLVTPSLHLHPGYTLGSSLDTTPAAGIYLAAFTMSATGRPGSAEYAESETFWIVFNLGRSSAEHAAAFDWAASNLVPAPGALGFLAAWLLAPVTGPSGRSRNNRRCARALP